MVGGFAATCLGWVWMFGYLSVAFEGGGFV